eukprot:COSAG01_NODE_3904_length_5560_cov_7.746383_1_plen_950_part_00
MPPPRHTTGLAVALFAAAGGVQRCAAQANCIPPRDPHGVWTLSDGVGADGSSAILSCNAGFLPQTLFGQTVVKLCHDGVWGPTDSVSCGPTGGTTTPTTGPTCTLPTTANGHWSAAPAGGFVIGSTTTLTCDPGYTAQSIFGQEQTLTCGTVTAGQWDGEGNVCLSSPTPPPPPPPVGAITCQTPNTANGVWSPDGSGAPSPPGGYAPGATARLVCQSGYSVSAMFGSGAVLTCGANGQWNRPSDDCLPTHVGSTCTLPTTANGHWSAAPAGGFVIGSTTTLTCDPGYSAQSVFGQEQTLTCGTVTAGQWAGAPDVCEQSTSPGPSPPATTGGACTLPTTTHGTWSPAAFGSGHTVGSITTLTCDSGYQAAGLFGNDQTLTCGATGQWSSVPAQCQPSAGGGTTIPTGPTCTLPVEHNGAWSSSPTGTFTAGSTTSLTCNTGYLPGTTFFGPTTMLTCTSTGQWDSRAAQCQQGTSTGGGQTTSTTCAAPANTAGGIWSQPGPQGFTQNTQVVLTCQVGYVIENLFGQQPTLTCICPGNGSPCDWNAMRDRCLPTGTPPPPPVGAITCQTPNTANGVWSPDGSGAPSPPGGYAPGATARLVCQSGYSVSAMFGSGAVLTCGANGQWNRPSDDCLPTHVGSTCTLPTTANGHWSAAPAGGFVIGSTTTLTCDPGYSAQSVFGQEQTLTCGTVTAGQWAGAPDVCEQSTSPGPSPPATTGGACTLPTTTHGTWSPAAFGSGHTVGSITTLTCDSGYQVTALFGTDQTLTCGATGQWSSVPAQCHFTQCMTCTTFGEYQACFSGLTEACCSHTADCAAGIPTDCRNANAACVSALQSTQTVCSPWLRSTSAMAGTYTKLTHAAATCVPLIICSSFSEFQNHAAAVTAECCDQPTEDCTGGYPSMCNRGCASVLLPVRDACDPWLRTMPSLSVLQNSLNSAAALCRHSSGGGH